MTTHIPWSAKTCFRGEERRRRWLSTVCLSASLVLASSCTDSGTDSGGHGSDSTVDAAQTVPVAAFDSPSRFDLTRAVKVPPEQAQFGTLHETALLWVDDDGTVRSTDMADPGRSWTTPLPIGQTHTYLMSPFVVGNVAVVATGENREVENDGTASFVINIVGVDVNDGSVLWSVSEQIDRAFAPSPVKNTYLEALKRDGDVPLAFYPLVDYPSLLLDPTEGVVRWKSHANVIPTMSRGYADSPTPPISGRYTVASYYNEMLSLDLATGQVAAEPLLRGRSRHVDPADPAYIILYPEEWASSQALLRFSTANGTVQAFTPEFGDTRYGGDYDCLYQEDPVWVCRSASPPYSVVGLESLSGDVRWTEDDASDNPAAFHGNVYLARSGAVGYAVVDRSTGQTITADIGIKGGPIQVNEYGVVGLDARHGDPLYGKWVWVPASG